MAVTYNDLTLDIRRSLRQAGIEAATLEARELVCFAAGKDRAALLRDGALYASPEVEEAAWALARRRLAGEPVAYLIGEWEFYGLPLDISESVLIPRPDTETLAEAAIGWLRQQEAPRVLDLCAGSGCLGLAIASQVKDARVVLGELSDGALRVCRQNIRRCGLTGRVTAMQLDALRPPVQRLGDFDCIVSNPPYIPTGDLPGLDPSVRDYEPHGLLPGHLRPLALGAASRVPAMLRGGHRPGRRRAAADAQRGLRRPGNSPGPGGHPPGGAGGPVSGDLTVRFSGQAF